MPAEFSRRDVLRIAQLANLELDADEVDLFVRQLGDILAHVNELQQIDTAGVPPTASVGEESIERADETRPCLDRASALALAPDPAPAAGLYKVPRVIG
jgi:aspartyl-tRNA(Asn)/glutamyl-tRNA(Gln) amidotransferase subunit C